MARSAWLGRAALVAVWLVVAPGAASAQVSLDPMLEPYLEKYELPALAAAVVRDGKVIAAGAVGTRRAGQKLPVTVKDRFHIGSDTKAMTALVAAMLVEEGKLRWDSTVAEIFPELAKDMNPDLRSVTLEQLLSHTSGLPSDDDEFNQLLVKSMFQTGNLDDQRYWLVKQASSHDLAAKPGEKFTYSNLGYVVVGAMLERIGGKTWEELVTERVFVPLGLASAGFGPQASLGKVDAPLGHDVVNGKLEASLAGPNGDNPSVIGPAGTVHLSLLDFARWAGWNAGEGRRGPNLVKPETLKKLHTPVVSMELKKDAAPGTPSSGRYGLGWGELTIDWSPGPLLFHGGSNTKNLAHIWVEPKQDLAIVTVTNVGGPKANDALNALAPELYTRFVAPTHAAAP